MLPGLHAALMLGNSTIVYSVNTTSVTPWESLGSPATPGIYRIIVPAGVILSSSGHPTPGMSLNFPVGSTVYLYVEGEIAGAGGAGGGGDRGRRDNGGSTTFRGGGGGGGTGRPGGAGGIAADDPDPDDDSTDGAAGTDTTPGLRGDNDFGGGIGDGSFVLGAVEQPGGDALDVTTAITLYLSVSGAGLIRAGGRGGRGGFQDGELPGGANGAREGLGPPTGIVATTDDFGWAIKLASGATVVPIAGVNSTYVKGAYAGATSA